MPASMHFPRSVASVSGDNLHQLPEFRDTRVLGLLPDTLGADADITFGEVTIAPGQVVPTHSNGHAEAIFIVEGTLRLWRPGGSVELSAPGAAYFPPGEAHSIANIGSEPARFLVAYATGGHDKTVTSRLLPDTALESGVNPNTAPSTGLFDRWAVAEDMVSWVPVEPSKGMRLRCRYLLEPANGTKEFVIGTAGVDPHLHYTIHRHAPAEIYHVLEGTATIYVGDDGYEVAPGDTVYVPAWAPHGIDTGDSELRMYWFYTLDACDGAWAWEPLEPVYSTPPRRPLETGPRRGFHV
ncbi:MULTISPECIES: cupin domain-containing protein [Nonomuraea]|uniref:Cupin domain-containing protein n=1 Tax=Nonomuraea ferruginea TaxID=46174 RepID=A0ABT4T0P4_9ACTN|nr:cupin domain-containing protein [Nonomuraea ferruginea]MDA0642885.1 cupin domain-containing protein [Nonomuraea ferruginea]